MSLSDVPIDKIELPDIVELEKSSASESRVLEFKEQLSVANDSDKIKFLATVSAFANTAGGTVVYGVKEQDGLATGVIGWEVPDRDSLVLALENLCRDSIEPRVHDLRMKLIPVTKTKVALVIRVPRSYRRPHVVRYKDHWRFYGRNSAGRYQLDVNEVKSIVLEGQSTTEKLRELRQMRIDAIRSGDSPWAKPEDKFAVLHIVPFEALFSDFEFDWSRITDRRVFLPPFGGSGHNDGYNSEGYVTFRGHHAEDSKAYLQLFRSGMVETADLRTLEPLRGQNAIASFALEREVIEVLTYFRQAADVLNLSSPYAVMLSLIGGAGFRLAVAAGYSSDVVIRSNRLLFGPLILPDLEGDIPRALRPIFDAVWNAGGHAVSMNYDGNGNWRGNNR